MKITKILTILTVIFSSLFLAVSCNNKTVETKKADDIIISKYFENGVEKENFIEIYNPTENEIDLNNYKLAVYSNGELAEKNEFDFQGKKISPKEFLLFGNSNEAFRIDSIFKDKEKIFNEELFYNGNDPITIEKESKIVDVIGYVGSEVIFGQNVSLIRNKDIIYPTDKFDIEKFIGFVPQYFDTLSQIDENADISIVAKGPRFNKKYLEQDYYYIFGPKKYGNGGAAKATVRTKIDGDTTYFDIESDYANTHPANKDLVQVLIKSRYYFIDTAESTERGGFQKWGKWGTMTTNALLDRAEKNGTLYIQSVNDDSLNDGYGRYLTLVWADGYLINWVLVRDSVAKYYPSDREIQTPKGFASRMHYKKILLRYYIQYAEFLAKKDNIRIHNYLDVDPMFDINKKNFRDDYEKFFKPTYEKHLHYEGQPTDFEEEIFVSTEYPKVKPNNPNTSSEVVQPKEGK